MKKILLLALLILSISFTEAKTFEDDNPDKVKTELNVNSFTAVELNSVVSVKEVKKESFSTSFLFNENIKQAQKEIILENQYSFKIQNIISIYDCYILKDYTKYSSGGLGRMYSICFYF